MSAQRVDNAQVFVDGVDVGNITGGVTVTLDRELTELNSDKFGSTPTDFAKLGDMYEFEVNMSDITIANLKRIIPDGILMPTDNDEEDATGIGFGSVAGGLQSENAVEVIIHPRTLDVSNTAHDWVMYKAVVEASLSDEISPDAQRIWTVTFRAIPDESKPEGRQLGHYGVLTS